MGTADMFRRSMSMPQIGIDTGHDILKTFST
jgi:hypothetical protein